MAPPRRHVIVIVPVAPNGTLLLVDEVVSAADNTSPLHKVP